MTVDARAQDDGISRIDRAGMSVDRSHGPLQEQVEEREARKGTEKEICTEVCLETMMIWYMAVVSGFDGHVENDARVLNLQGPT